MLRQLQTRGVPGKVSPMNEQMRTRMQPLWEGPAPLARGEAAGNVPTLTWFMPVRPTGAAVVVCPGGGYGMLADHEGAPVAEWLAGLGITAAVLRYRVAPHRHPAPLLDAARAIRTLRHRAEELKLDARRIGILGFSAGGHLASTISTHHDVGDESAADPIERHSSRPDFSILLYPVISMQSDVTHHGSVDALLGENPAQADRWNLSNELRIRPDTPPAFLFHTMDDAAVPVENAVRYALGLRAAGVSAELHIYASGPHGVGLAGDHAALRSWPGLCADWLRQRGFAG